MPTIEVWVVLGGDGSHEAATDEDTAIDRLQAGSNEDFTGTACRVVKLRVELSEPRYRDDDDETDKAVDVAVPDDAGHIVEV